jgi:SAM-dependent methyltransferase
LLPCGPTPDNGSYASGLPSRGLTIVSLSCLVYPWLLKLMVDRFGGRMDSPFHMTMLFSLLLLLFVISSAVGYYQQFDIVVFNASLHYSHDILRTVHRAMHLLTPGGKLYILDSPLYDDAESGRSMVRERRDNVRMHHHVQIPEEHGGNILTLSTVSRLRETYRLEVLLPVTVFAGACVRLSHAFFAEENLPHLP